jgi:hypothetical protein
MVYSVCAPKSFGKAWSGSANPANLNTSSCGLATAAFHLGPLRNDHRPKVALQMQVNFCLGKRIQ